MKKGAFTLLKMLIVKVKRENSMYGPMKKL